MTSKIYYPHQIDLSRIIYSDLNDAGIISQVYISYDDPILGERPLLIYLPSLFCNDDVDVKGEKSAIFELMLCLMGKNKKEDELIINFFKDLDKKFYEDGIEHEKLAKKKKAKMWFADLKKTRYKDIIKSHECLDFMYQNGIIKLKAIINNNFQTKFYFKKGKRILPKNIPKVFAKKCYVKSIIEIAGLGINNKTHTYQAFIRPHQIRVSYGSHPLPVLEEYSIMDDSDEHEIDHTSAESESTSYLKLVDSENLEFNIFHKKITQTPITDSIDDFEHSS